MFGDRGALKLHKSVEAVSNAVFEIIDKSLQKISMEEFLDGSRGAELIPGLHDITYGQLRQVLSDTLDEVGARNPIALYHKVESRFQTAQEKLDRDFLFGQESYGLTKEDVRACAAKFLNDEVKKYVKVLKIAGKKLNATDKISDHLAESKAAQSGRTSIQAVSAISAGTTYFVAKYLAGVPSNRLANAICAGISCVTYAPVDRRLVEVPNSSSVKDGVATLAGAGTVIVASVAAQVVARKAIRYGEVLAGELSRIPYIR